MLDSYITEKSRPSNRLLTTSLVLCPFAMLDRACNGSTSSISNWRWQCFGRLEFWWWELEELAANYWKISFWRALVKYMLLTSIPLTWAISTDNFSFDMNILKSQRLWSVPSGVLNNQNIFYWSQTGGQRSGAEVQSWSKTACTPREYQRSSV